MTAALRQSYERAMREWAYTIEYLPELADMKMGQAGVYRDLLGVDMNQFTADLRSAQHELVDEEDARKASA